MREQQRLRAEPSRRGRRLAAGMPAADHNDIVRSDRLAHSAVIYGRAAPMSSVSRETSTSIERRQWNLLADAEVAEDHVEQIFDVDRTSDPAETAQGQPEIFGAE